MKKIVSLSLLSVFLFGLMASQGFGQKATDIMEKYIEAAGGRKRLSNIKDTTMIGSLNVVMVGMSGSLTWYQKEPNMMRWDMEVMGMTMTQAFDGEVAWGTNPQTGAGAPIDVRMPRIACGSKVWVQAKNATDNATIDFFCGGHEYPG